MPRRTTIDSLPTELLENIFEAGVRIPIALEEHYPRLPLFSKRPHVPLFAATLSQVCLRWRNITLDTPYLWSFIHVTRSLETHRRLQSDVGRSLDWVLMYIERSAALPLHLTIDATRIPVSKAVDLLAPCSSRWSSFVLLVSHVGNLPPILPLLVHTNIPRLSYLSIMSDIYREGIVSYDPFVPFFIRATHKLATIRLTGVYIAWNALPLANLQNLELHFTARWPKFVDLQRMFDASPRLCRLVVRDDLTSILRHVDQPAGQPAIEIPNLTHLEVEVFRHRDDYMNVTGFMGLFSLPSLEQLILRNLKVEEWMSITEIYDLPRNAFDHPVPPPARGRHSYVRRRTFPFLSQVIATSYTSAPGRTVPPSNHRFF
ncbi:hypothetical protein D9619_005025 [Psilocybe cf. subviscida]|uniref:F-box domain-containing protein n=1 Tax=Psilocybe cf. subviscida TaxID=2480587 RepID=A0A8H5BR11_9AGAR|nr:hypothetical protein D9619_005025 [Psilocybe cf. subviscida]